MALQKYVILSSFIAHNRAAKANSDLQLFTPPSSLSLSLSVTLLCLHTDKYKMHTYLQVECVVYDGWVLGCLGVVVACDRDWDGEAVYEDVWAYRWEEEEFGGCS